MSSPAIDYAALAEKARQAAPDYAALAEQARKTPAVSSAPDAPGYFETLKSDAAGMLGAIRHPIDTATSMLNESNKHQQEMKKAAEAGDTAKALGHFVQSIPMLGPFVYETVNDLKAGNYARPAARLTEALVLKGAGKAAETVATTPGGPQMALGAAEGVAGGAAALAGHPYIGSGIIADAARRFIKGFDASKQPALEAELAKIPPAMTLEQVKAQLKARADEITPSDVSGRLPPELPQQPAPAAQVSPVAGPQPAIVDPAEVQPVQPSAPVYDIGEARKANAAKQTELPGADEAMIRSLERRKFLAPREKQLLADLKAKVAAGTQPYTPPGTPGSASMSAAPDSSSPAAAPGSGVPPVSPESPATQGIAPEPQPAPVSHGSLQNPQEQPTTIPFAKENPPAEAFAAKARATRAENVEALAQEIHKNGTPPEAIPLILKVPARAAQLRDAAKALGLELPKDLTKTVVALQARVAELQQAKRAAAGLQPSPEYADVLKRNPKAAAAAAALAEEMNAPSADSVHVPESIAPQLSTGREEPYVVGVPTTFHSSQTVMERIGLEGRDAEVAHAYVTNPSGIELLFRLLNPQGHIYDRGALHSLGAQISPADMWTVARKLERIKSQPEYRDMGKPWNLKGLNQLLDAVKRAAEEQKALVIVKDQNAMPDTLRNQALTEELNHARQSDLGGGRVEQHLWGNLNEFMRSSLGLRAAEALRNRGYSQYPDSGLSAEIGVRLMDEGRFKELGLDAQEARQLAADYVRALRKEHGSAAPREIAKRVFEGSRKPQSRAQSAGIGSTGREGAAIGIGQNIPENIGVGAP